MSPPPGFSTDSAQTMPLVARERVRDIDAQLRTIFQLAPVGIGLVDLHGRTILTNDAMRDLLGYSAEQFASVHFEEFTHPDDVAANLELFAQMAAGEIDRFEMDKRFFRRDGRLLWGRLTVSLLRDADGLPDLAIGMVENVTEQRELQAQLQHAEQTFRTLVEQVPAVVYEAGLFPGEPWTYVSPQIQHLLGFPPAQWLSSPELWRAQISPEDRDRVLDGERTRGARRGDDDGVVTLHYRMRRADGREIWIRDESSIVTDLHGHRVLRGVLADATREKQLEARLERLAYHDALTLLANRERFRDRVDACMRDDRPDRTGAVLFIDLDDFKTINDSLGHAAGDDLICAVAGRIRGCVRPADLPGRLGGDEFAVLLEELADPADAVEIAERLRAALARPHRLRGRTVHASASVGVAYLADADTTEAVLRNADLAMYRAKGSGKACIATYEPQLHRDALRRLDLRSALGGALGRGELFLQYQPLVDLTSAEMLGLEALLRWRQPGGGLISPDEFIPLAEETGDIGPIGRWVLGEATHWLAENRWMAGGELSISVNVSPVQLESRLVADVEAALVSSGIAPERLVVEVTEQALMNLRGWDVVRELKALGVRIAIDDFGTGYSSLAYLSEFAVDMLKIDRSFIAGLTAVDRSQAVPRAVVELARTLGLTVVAEGIETDEQWEQLLQIGCRVGQGYRFARPVDPSELPGPSVGPLARPPSR